MNGDKTKIIRRYPVKASMLRSPAAFLALGFGSGLSPIMPGTCGTIAAIPIYILLHFLPAPLYFIAIALLFIVGIWICGVTAKKLKIHDHPAIVWDEIVGFLITMLLAPFNWLWILLGFILFRVFDIFKPWPVRYADKHLTNGFGIMADDLLAAIYALVILQIIISLCRMFCG